MEVRENQRWGIYEMGDMGQDLFSHCILVERVHEDFFVYQDYRDCEYYAMKNETFERYVSEGSVELVEDGVGELVRG